MTGEARPKVLVTGATGYVGRAAVRHLRALGCTVHALGRHDPGDGIAWHRTDLLADGDLVGAVADIDAQVCLHLAWSVPPGRFWTHPDNLDWVGASLRLFRAFVAAGGRRVVGVGSCAEYAWDVPLLREEMPLRPDTLYGRAKAALADLLFAFAQQEGVEAAWARLFFLYGPGEPEGKLVSDAASILLRGGRVATTPGEQSRDFLHVDDVGRALALLSCTSMTGPVNIASGQAVRVREVLERIERLTDTEGRVDYGQRSLAAGEPMKLVGDVSRLRDEVGFRPHFSLEAGLRDTVDHWRQRLQDRVS
ncbi:NAD(P)-dependent oxidoreductase [Novosphingobium sp. LASN5T]|uniref:NAD-dependent epimerase/dehydratase family protein n=1 Tax=Novosphingobium sp. LASN5T TaxID=2491021 RepID=UPI000F5F6706|nr:NAD(P)-dependent oxidoreductase [Novosphingobium sp. LASN5T]RQW37687.1 NAD(P)-dependent oxidoreductase [Novosphingobium sp. LASN5T]